MKVATATAMFTAALSTDDTVEGLLALSSPCVSVTRCRNESDEVYTSVLINPVSDASVQTNIPSCSDTSVETDLSSVMVSLMSSRYCTAFSNVLYIIIM